MNDLDTCQYVVLGGGICKAPAETWGKREVGGVVRVKAWCHIHNQYPTAWQIRTEALTREEAEVLLIMQS